MTGMTVRSADGYTPYSEPSRHDGRRVGRVAAFVAMLTAVSTLAAWSFSDGEIRSIPALTIKANSTPVVDVDSIGPILQRQVRALTDGDEPGWLAAVDPADEVLVARYRKIYALLRALGVARLDVIARVPDGGAWSDPIVRRSYGAPSVIELDLLYGYCGQIADCPYLSDKRKPYATRLPTDLFAARQVWSLGQDGYRITNFTLEESSAFTTQPFVISDLRWRAGPRVTVLASAGLERELPRVLTLAERAASVVDGYARWPKPRRYVLYLANRSEWQRWFGGIDDKPNILGYAMETSESADTVMLNYSRAKRGELPELIRHEFAHVLTLLGGPANVDDYLVEGIAEYVAENHAPVRSYGRLYDVRSLLRRGKWRTIENTSIDGGSRDMSAGYGIGYLTWRCIAQRYGEERMLTFADHILRTSESPTEAAPATLGVTWPKVVSTCTSYVRSAAG